MVDRWKPGELIVRREILGFDPIDAADKTAVWYQQCWEAMSVRVVQDDEDALVVYLPSGAPLTFPDGSWPVPNGLHPWHGRERWHGHGCLMVQRPGEHHAIWHFWDGPERTFMHWYINIQTAFRRTADVIDTQDLELDLLSFPDGSWEMKDWDVMDERVAEGRYTAELVDWIRALGTDLGLALDQGQRWWDETWATWTPPDGWDSAPE